MSKREQIGRGSGRAQEERGNVCSGESKRDKTAKKKKKKKKEGERRNEGRDIAKGRE